MNERDKPLVWLRGEVKSPPFSLLARIEAGFLLRQVQAGIRLSMPQSRPMSLIGDRCHEIRIQDRGKTWRIIYRIDRDVIVIADVFEKKTNKTPKGIIENCKRRLRNYDEICQGNLD